MMTNQLLYFHCGHNKGFHIKVRNILRKTLEMLNDKIFQKMVMSHITVQEELGFQRISTEIQAVPY